MHWRRLCAASCTAALCTAAQINISNTQPRRDIAGNIMDVHDGVLRQWTPGGLFHWYGMGYGPCNITADGCAGMLSPPHCGFRTTHAVNLFTSPDLVSWTFVRDVLPAGAGRPESIYFRPQVVYNAVTQRFVLWVNRVSAVGGDADYFNATYLVASSPTPDGPFNVVSSAVATRYGGLGVGDLALLVDPADGTAYLAYAAFAAGLHSVSVERLAPDYLSSLAAAGDPTQSSGVITPDFYEAPLLLSRRGIFYLFAGPVCCFCAAGAATRVWTASSPLGPWSEGGWLDPPGAANSSTIGAQDSFLAVVPLSGGVDAAVVWAGDRWASAPDGLFSHNAQYWAPLVFNDSGALPAAVAPLSWVDSFSLDLA